MSLRDLNWRKGFSRLWLFFSVLWIVTIGIVALYPSTSRYIENVNTSRELQTLRASISYKFLEEPDNNSHSDASGQTAPLPSKVSPSEALPGMGTGNKESQSDEWKVVSVAPIKRYKAEELQTGVTVTFEWYETQPPTERDFDDVFCVALGPPFPTLPKSAKVMIPPLPPE